MPPADLIDQLEDIDALLEAVIARYEAIIADLDGVDPDKPPCIP